MGVAIAAAVAAFIMYLVLTAGSGDVLFFWSKYEFLAGIFFAVITGLISWRFMSAKDRRMANPGRWFLFLGYVIGPFFLAMAKANLDVAYRVITGRINPGIVRISPGLKTDLGVTMLANSITLTPGTLSVDVDEETNDLYIHWINVKNTEPKAEEVCGSFPKWIRRIAE